MSRDDVLRMAREAKFPVNHPDWADAAVRFAALVAADANHARIAAQDKNEELKAQLAAAGVAERRAVHTAVLAERAACLESADLCADADMHASMAANAIRARRAL